MGRGSEAHIWPFSNNRFNIFENKMARAEYQTASFMMLCLGDFSSKLCIPTKFMTKYKQVVQQSMILESDYSGKCWDVKIKKMNSDFYMKDGWPEFVKDNQLADLDFLTFRFNGDSTFKVSIYRSDGCPKHPSSPTSSDGGDVDESGIKREGGRRRKSTPEIPIPTSCSAYDSRRRSWFFKKGNPLYFGTRLKCHQKFRISLPSEFSKAANMKAKEKVGMEYVGCNRHGIISVAVDPRPEGKRIDLARGWPQFRQANRLVYGKMYSFEFNPDYNIIHVKEVAAPLLS